MVGRLMPSPKLGCDLHRPDPPRSVRDVHEHALSRLFTIVSDVKPTKTNRKWMVSSKVLYHLLPDLVPPVDNEFTAPFLGYKALPPGLDEHSLGRHLRSIQILRAEWEPQRLEELAREADSETRLGLARVIDFGVIGFRRFQTNRSLSLEP